MLKEFLKQNIKGFNYKNFIAMKIQLSLILMTLTGFTFFLTGFYFTASLEIIFSLVFFHSLTEAKKEFTQDFKLFVLLFGSFYLIIQLIWLNQVIIPAENRIDFGFVLIFILVIITVIYTVLIKKNTIKGKVISSNGKVTVIETEFDLRSFTKGGKHIIETPQKFNEGTEIKIKIQKSIIGKHIEII